MGNYYWLRDWTDFYRYDVSDILGFFAKRRDRALGNKHKINEVVTTSRSYHVTSCSSSLHFMQSSNSLRIFMVEGKNGIWVRTLWGVKLRAHFPLLGFFSLPNAQTIEPTTACAFWCMVEASLKSLWWCDWKSPIYDVVSGPAYVKGTSGLKRNFMDGFKFQRFPLLDRDIDFWILCRGNNVATQTLVMAPCWSRLICSPDDQSRVGCS